jgi:hypothetical protein
MVDTVSGCYSGCSKASGTDVATACLNLTRVLRHDVSRLPFWEPSVCLPARLPASGQPAVFPTFVVPFFTNHEPVRLSVSPFTDRCPAVHAVWSVLPSIPSGPSSLQDALSAVPLQIYLFRTTGPRVPPPPRPTDAPARSKKRKGAWGGAGGGGGSGAFWFTGSGLYKFCV